MRAALHVRRRRLLLRQVLLQLLDQILKDGTMSSEAKGVARQPQFRVLACASLALLNVLNAICESWVALSPRSEHFEKSRARSPRREGREGELQSLGVCS